MNLEELKRDCSRFLMWKKLTFESWKLQKRWEKFMKILLIYKSKTGFTEKYARWISEEIDCKIENISNLRNIDFGHYDLIIYGSRIHAFLHTSRA